MNEYDLCVRVFAIALHSGAREIECAKLFKIHTICRRRRLFPSALFRIKYTLYECAREIQNKQGAIANIWRWNVWNCLWADRMGICIMKISKNINNKCIDRWEREAKWLRKRFATKIVKKSHPVPEHGRNAVRICRALYPENTEKDDF